MKSLPGACASLLVAVSVTLPAHADDTPSDAPGWTGVTHPRDVIVARQVMMAGMSRLMTPIDRYAAGERADTGDVRDAAAAIAELLLGFPHLFPPTTNLYDPEADLPVTAALPAIWDDFSAFYAMSAVSQGTAEALVSMSEAEALRSGALRLRATCDGCHAVYLEQYSPPTATDTDADFDFDSFFESVD